MTPKNTLSLTTLKTTLTHAHPVVLRRPATKATRASPAAWRGGACRGAAATGRGGGVAGVMDGVVCARWGGRARGARPARPALCEKWDSERCEGGSCWADTKKNAPPPPRAVYTTNQQKLGPRKRCPTAPQRVPGALVKPQQSAEQKTRRMVSGRGGGWLAPLTDAALSRHPVRCTA